MKIINNFFKLYENKIKIVTLIANEINVKQNNIIIANIINKTKADPIAITIMAHKGRPFELFVVGCGCEGESKFYKDNIKFNFQYEHKLKIYL